MAPPEIPKRTSSKRHRAELETERDSINQEVKKIRQDLKPQASFNSAYWIQTAEIAIKSRSTVSLEMEISEQFHEEQGLEGEFSQSKKALRLREQSNALEAEERLLREQAALVDTEGAIKDEGKSRRRAFIELFTTSKIGLAIANTGRGRRPTSAQSNFRAECIERYNSSSPDPRQEALWCPILKTWVIPCHATAAHLFAYMHGQDVMDSIFGVMPSPELFSPRNGMIVSTAVEQKFDKGFMAIVPRLPDRPTPAEVQLWNSSDPKEYKIRIINLKDLAVDKFIPPQTEQTWRDLDGTNVEFRSDYRPRARYLYFNYCIQILRRAWRAEQNTSELLRKEFKAGFWGTRGSYLPGSMLRAFVEELGHGYEELLAGAVDDSTTTNPEDEKLLVGALSLQVKALGDERGDEEEWDNDGGDQEEDDDDDDDAEEGEDMESYEDEDRNEVRFLNVDLGQEKAFRDSVKGG